MHIHGNSMGMNSADAYSAGNAEKAAAAQRAADVRKRLLKGAAALDGTDSPDEALLIGHWLDRDHFDGAQANGQSAHDDTEPHSWRGRDPDFG